MSACLFSVLISGPMTVSVQRGTCHKRTSCGGPEVKTQKCIHKYQNIKRLYTNFENLSTEDKFIWLLSCEDKEIISLSSKQLIDLFKERILTENYYNTNTNILLAQTQLQ